MIPLVLRSPLTERQEQILQMLADDVTQQEVAFKLGISYQTVKNHIYGNGGRDGVGKRLGKTTVTASVAEAIRYGWIV